ncbi:MAG: phosphoribosylanthranilate isomerase [Chitinivibrionia bacterium]|nr:phosphoribosylanthranilate isomerase [Chitinivibrionia bacterium]
MKVKICGITAKTALETAIEAGADFVGFVFFEKSKRNISIEKAKVLAKIVPKTVKKVGVFVNENIENLLKIANEIPLDIVQLHGNETWQYCEKIPFEIIKAIKVIDGKFSQNPDDFPNITLMFDAQISGSGEKFDWNATDFSKIKGRKFFIAGGLNPENVKEAIEYFSPFAVDVSSGVETNGQKDNDKIREFLKNARV